MSGELFGPALTTPAMDAAVSDEAWLRALLRFESELAAAEAGEGVIPADAAEAIAAACGSAELDARTLGAHAIASATPVVPFLSALRRKLPDESHRHLHFGATSQDALDTAAMLIASAAIGQLDGDLRRLAAACAELAERHAATGMSGRTLMRRARPTTFGLKAAGWLVAVEEARTALDRFRQTRLSVQLGGAAGSLDVLGVAGVRVAQHLAERLGLTEPVVPWHANRTRVAELAGHLAVAGGAAAKIALDVILLSQDEVGEVEVSAPGASSSMPEKRNAARAVEARAAHSRLLGVVPPLLASMASENERAAGAWQAEWSAISDAFRFTAGAVAGALDTIRDLHVDVARMRQNAEDGEPPAAAGELIRRALRRYGPRP
jgi:3-carboxy-cis,cis-muconate cycloisomerase